MGLYDVIGDIANREIIKTDTGDNRIFGVLTALVVENYDENLPGRVKVAVVTRDNTENNEKILWARLAMPASGATWGHYFMPEKGDYVLLTFEQGNIEKPYIIGCIPLDNSKFVGKVVDKDNITKTIVTKHGSAITFTDAVEGDGDKDVITVTTAKNKCTLQMNNEAQMVELTDGKNSLKITTENGKMALTAEKLIELKVGSNITVSLNGESGTVEITADKFKVKTTGDILTESSGKTKVSAASIDMESNTSVNITGGSTVKVKGEVTDIG